MVSNYFQGGAQKPFHLSVGAVLIDDEDKVVCHYFDQHEAYKDFYILMRETMLAGESPEESLARGLMEEFGATAKLLTYVGSRQSQFRRQGIIIHKTVIYFAMRLINMDMSKRMEGDEESASEIRRLSIDDLAAKMRSQRQRYETDLIDLDESNILQNTKSVLGFIQNNC